MHNLLGITALTTGARDRTCYLTENSNFEIHGPFPKQDQSWTAAIVDHATIRDLLAISCVSPAINFAISTFDREIYLRHSKTARLLFCGKVRFIFVIYVYLVPQIVELIRLSFCFMPPLRWFCGKSGLLCDEVLRATGEVSPRMLSG